jgi:hypothetical protein
MRRLPLLLAVFLILCPPAVLGQGGASTDIITGRVLDLAGEPLPSAVVSATALDTGIRRTTLSNPQGRYTLIFPDGGGAYRLEVSHIGMRTTVVLVERGPTEDVMVADVRMSIAPIVLQEVRARGARAEASPETQERVIDGDWITLMPINPGDLAAVASLSAGVVGLEATDSIGSGGFSVIGQRPDLNHISLDGATFGPPRGETGGGLGIPAEAIRLTRVITNSYDVARGQFSGGQIASTTRGGTNRPQGTVSYSLHEPRLQWYGDGSPFNRAYTQHRVSGGYGGPLIRDRLFFFGSAAVQHRSQDLQSLMQADAGALERLGAHPDSVARFLETLRAQGLSPAEPAASSRQLIEELSLFGRLDYTLSQRHSVMLRGDLRWDHRDGTRVSSLGLPHSGGNNDALGGGVMVGVTSRVREQLINEFRIYVSQRETDQAPYFPVPEGRVRVTSELDDGAGAPPRWSSAATAPSR